MTKKPLPDHPRILFLYSDTGGGHRSAAEALIEALKVDYGDQVHPEMVDIFRDYSPPPFSKFPELYPYIVRLPQAWELGFRMSNGHRRARLLTASSWPYVRRAFRSMISAHPSDLIVSVHPMANAPALRALGKNHPPFITVVTDLVTTHALWFHRRVDLCIVPTEAARQRALLNGLRENQVHVVGLPVADRFTAPAGNKEDLRLRLGWPKDRLVVLLVGGGEGMGPLEQTARAIASARLPMALVVIAGRNQALKARLEGVSWQIPTFTYGFVHEMPDFMRAADVLVTKAGPGTISEAFIAGLPIVLYSRLPGQEEGNVSYVVSRGAGVWAPEPNQIVAVLRDWLRNPEKRRTAAKASLRLARPQASHKIAHILADWAGVKKRQS